MFIRFCTFPYSPIDGCPKLDCIFILECIQSKDFEAAELIIKSELNEITQRNKIIKIADRHGWDVVKEYYISHLADDNEDAVKLRAAINGAIRKRAKPYEHSNSTFTTGRGFYSTSSSLGLLTVWAVVWLNRNCGAWCFPWCVLSVA
jgi:hypothetical protein